MDDRLLAALSGDKGFVCFEESLKYTLRSSSNHIKLASIYLPMHKIFVFFVVLDVLVINEKFLFIATREIIKKT